VVVVATLSHKFRREQSPQEQIRASNSALYYMPYMSMQDLLAVYGEYNRVIRLVASETNTILVEHEDNIPGDDLHFNDSVHFTDLGARLMAERVTSALEGAVVRNFSLAKNDDKR
jgi:hypothetical protein